MRKTVAGSVCSVLVGALLLATTTSAAAGQPFRCDPDVNFELDANGIVTAYPSGRCVGDGVASVIDIQHTFSVDDRVIDGFAHSRKHYNKSAGVYVGVALDERNPEGTNGFCSSITVYWSMKINDSARSSTARTCANY